METKRNETQRVGIVLRPSTPELKEMFYRAKEIFETQGIEVVIEHISGSMIGVLGQPFETLCETCDMLVCIGGDGTLISAVRRSFPHQTPVLGVHAGKLGFLADLSIDELEDFVGLIKTGDYRLDQRSLLQATITTRLGETKVIAFNDIVITRPSISKMIHLDTYVDGKPFNTYYGDGVIVSTPTGSTAYNLSAGGPVLYPMSHVFALTPISPHSLTQRPVVLPGHFAMEVRTPDQSALVVVDGQDMYKFGEGDIVRIHLAEETAQLVHRRDFSYFEVLKEKLRWGD
jgi:NAD+ kinase